VIGTIPRLRWVVWATILIDKDILNIAMKSRRSDCVSAILLGILVFFLGGIGALSIGVSPAGAVSYNNRIVMNSDFSGQDLTDASFDHADLRGSDLSHTNAPGVRFFSANLESVNFEGANLTNADLESARLTRTNFTNAVLVGIFATNAKFGGAMIEGADFTDALLRPDVEKMLCEIATGKNPTTGRNTRDTLNCPS
jgi:uncharacterized protein YjbI with pentapeptide repeats